MSDTLDRPDERWRLSNNPYTLARLVKGRREGKRKYRLLVAAFIRRVWSKLNPEQRAALEVIERYADGAAKYNEMRLAVQGMRIDGHRSQPLLVEAARRDAWSGVPEVIGELLGMLWSSAPDDLEEALNGPLGGSRWITTDYWKGECAALCHIVRDAFADVFRPVALDPSWRTSTVLQLAEAAYAHREQPANTFEPLRLAVLADALQDAGCAEPLVLDHLRGPGPHAPGCWVVDLLLGKEA
jgi:hypothetical protein